MAQKFTVPVTIKNLSSAGSDGLTVFLDQESFARLKVEAGGRITWGSGAGAGDTNLYRDAESVLKTDDTFKAAGLYVAGTQIDTTGATNGDALVFNGTKFVSASVAGGSGASLTVSDTPPAGAEEGDLWFSSLELEVYVYYSSAWIQVTDSSSGVQELYELVDVLIEDPVYGETLVYNGTEWENGIAGAAVSLETARIIQLSGDVSGSVSFDGSQNVNIATTVQPNSIALGTDTTGNYVSSLVAGTGVTLSNNSGETATPTIAIGQAVGTSASVTFTHVSADLTGDVTGNADTATALQNARTIELIGDVSGSASFDGTSNINLFTTVNTASVAIGELYGVNISNPLEFQTLEYDGTEWVNANAQSSVYVRNAEATTITTGTAVYLFGATGDHATVKRADNTVDTTSSKTVGLVSSNILASENGVVITQGYVDGIDLSTGYVSGDVLWLGKNGQFTKDKPSAPDHLVFIGVVVRATSNGIVYVSTQNGYELDELHDVKISGLSDGQFLRYNSASTMWVNDTINLGSDTVGDYVSTITAGTGITVTGGTGESSTPTVSIGQAVGTSDSPTFAGLNINGSIIFEGTTANEFETTLSVTDPTADNAITLPNVTGTVVTTGDTGTVTSAMIADATIVNGDISTTAAIELSKLADATIDVKTSNYSLVLTDKNKFIKMNSSSNRTITVPAESTVNFPTGSQINLIRYGSGTLEVVAAGSVTIYSTPGRFLRAQYSSATLLKCADTNVWMLIGDLSA